MMEVISKGQLAPNPWENFVDKEKSVSLFVNATDLYVPAFSIYNTAPTYSHVRHPPDS